MNKKNAGLTFIELLIVVAILGILSSLAVPALNNYRAKSNDATAMSDARNSLSILSPQLTR